MLINDFTLGSDVEFFVAHRSNGSIASAEGFIPGTKKEPFRFDKNQGFGTQLDNVLAEGNIPPTRDARIFSASITKLRTHLDNVLREHELKIVERADAIIPEKYLQTENAQSFGCDPSYNAWTLKEERINMDIAKTGLRSAGFHIHIGYENPSEEINIAIIRVLDATLGLQCAMVEPRSQRREVGYGLAGSFRHQPHGVEYRTPSSWMAQGRFPHWVAAYTSQVISVNLGTHSGGMKRVISRMKVLTEMGDKIQEAINTQSAAKAESALNLAIKNGIYSHHSFSSWKKSGYI